jgi:Lar family restriction alleviation protein
MSVKLLPCPFCGGDDLALDENSYKTKWVICDGCGATIDDSPHGDCVDLWNRRGGRSVTDALPEAQKTL